MFITEEDLGQSIYNEVLHAVSREDSGFINRNIGRAIKEVDGYLNQKYDTAVLWAQIDDSREQTILGIVIDVALYHIHSVLEEVPVIRRERYDYAKSDLKDIRKGEIRLSGIPLLTETNTEDESLSEIISGTNSKRY
jgi:hypothetical protein